MKYEVHIKIIPNQQSVLELLIKDKFIVNEFNSNYNISSEIIDEIDDPEKIKEYLEKRFEIILGVFGIDNSEKCIIEINSLLSVVNGKPNYVMFAGTGKFKLSGGAVISLVNGVETNQHDFQKELLLKSGNNIAIQRILKIYATGNRNWIDLYKIFEIIVEDIGRKKLDTIIDPKEKTRFTYSANSISVSKEESRHAKKIGNPSFVPMDISDAKIFIYTLFKNWISKKG